MKTQVFNIPTAIGTLSVALTKPDGGDKHKLVLFSHGSGSSVTIWTDLIETLVENGFTVAALEHPGNNRRDNSYADTIENLSERPRHITLALNELQTYLKNFSSYKVAVIGHSIGAYTALAAAGGLPHTRHQIEHDPSTKITRSEAIPTSRDSRIDSLVLLNPAAGWFASVGSLENMDCPVLILTGDKDDVTPHQHAEIIMRELGSDAELAVVPNAGHFSFMNVFHEKMKHLPPARDPEGFDRAESNKKVYPLIISFLDRTL